jgi:hypothetical protein
MSLRWVVRLYPRRWRQRYGEEFLALLESQPSSFALLVDVLAGAIDARLHRDYSLAAAPAEEITVFRKCIQDGSSFAAAVEQFGAPIVVLLACVAVWLWLTARWGETPATTAFQYAGLSAVFFTSWGVQGLRLHSHGAKAAVMALALVVFYGISFLATWAAYQI